MKNLIEKLSAIEHERWSDWQKYLFSKCSRGMRVSGKIGNVKFDSNDLEIPSGLVYRWQKQIDTPYAKLSESEKQSDRDQVNRYLNLIKKEFLKKFLLGIFIGIFLAHLYIASTNHPLKHIKWQLEAKERCVQFGGATKMHWMFDYGIYSRGACKCNPIHCDYEYANYLDSLDDNSQDQ